jgi:hypothetical protein
VKRIPTEEDEKVKAMNRKPPPPGSSKGKSEQALVMTDVGLNLDGVTKNMGNLWLADLVASCYITFSEEGMYDCKEKRLPGCYQTVLWLNWCYIIVN